MEQLEKDWTVYPVLHIDFSGSKYMEAESLRASINVQLLLWENVYGRRKAKTHLVYVWKVSSAALMSKPGSRLSY